MIAALLQEIIKQFSLKVLYIEILWFLIVGYGMNVLVVMALTKLPMQALPKSIARLHVAAMLGSYTVAPVLAALSLSLSRFYSFSYQSWFIGQQVYIWYAVCMMMFSSYALCAFFVTVTCSRFRTWLFFVNGFVGALGFFVLKAMNVLVIN